MKNEEIRRKVVAIICELSGKKKEEIKPESFLVGEIFDPNQYYTLGAFVFRNKLQEEFDAIIDTGTLLGLKTVQDVFDFLCRGGESKPRG